MGEVIIQFLMYRVLWYPTWTNSFDSMTNYGLYSSPVERASLTVECISRLSYCLRWVNKVGNEGLVFATHWPPNSSCTFLSVPLFIPFSLVYRALPSPHFSGPSPSWPTWDMYLITGSLLKGANLGKFTILIFGNLMNNLHTWVAEVIGSARTWQGYWICEALGVLSTGNYFRASRGDGTIAGF